MGNIFVRRPIVAIVIAIVMVIVGSLSMLQLPMEQYPDITPPMVEVRANYTGANALNVEQSVATPLEQQINGVDNMIYMKSTNANDGSMAIQISFEVGTDPDMNTVFAQNRVSAATAKLPEEVKRLGVTTNKSMSSIVLALAVYSDGRYDQEFLGNYSLINIQDILARIKGVGRVNVLGASDYSMRIWVKPDRLAQLGITVPEIMGAVKEQNVIVPGGKFGAEPAPPGTEFTYTVTLPERLVSEKEFGDIVIRNNKDGSQVKVKDVASIELGVERYTTNAKFKGQDCALITIYQAPGTNAVELGQNIISAMDGLSNSFPEGVTYDIALDATAPITAGLKEVAITLVIALLLVILVVYLFIQDWRATLIPTIAIPVSLIAAFALFPLLGFSINTLSLLGLVLAIGIVVDDAIVVVEAVQVNIANGMDSKEATIKAMKEVTAPVIATTLVLVAVFIPVAAMGGITGRLYQQFAITIAVSVCFSSINALSLSPALASLLLRKPAEPKGLLGKFFKGFNKAFDRSSVSYMNATNIFARKIKRSVIYIGIVVVLMMVLGKMVPGGFIPEEDQGYLFINVQLPDASSLQRTDKVLDRATAILSQVEYVASATSASGFNMLSGSNSTNAGVIFLTLKDWAERDKTANEIAQYLNYLFYSQIKEAQVYAFGPPAIPGLGNGSGFSLMLQDKSGSSPQYLAEQAAKFIQAANQRPEIARIFTTFRANVPQRKLNINRDKALKSGVSLNDLYTSISVFLGGAYVNDFNRFGRLYKAYIQAEPEYRQNGDQLNLFFVKNRDGESLPLSSLVEVDKSYGPDFTNRFNLYRSAELSGTPAAGYTSTQALDALEQVAAEVLPATMSYEWSGMSYQEKKASGSGSIVFVFALIFVFLILAAQYESWSLPFSILLGTPFAVFGAMLFVWIARFFSLSFENNVFMQISLVMLIAMAAKNAILIVEFAKLKFEEGLSLYDAAIESARLRFRPILMTAFSFILGVFPLVMASGAGAEARKVMGMALLGGMVLATVLGVLLYPMLFILIGRLAGYEKKRELAAKKQQS
ncbi:efflux RND transporter permease subunit [Mangrovibacterium diazotrophicum]|uniref:HAE1 family hydrophobic/amphiphilic exporter-1 n=1 Tax=Mangrovibacterium diazotrophicum TaxID=1261403 RepID=A0A419W9L2_9BACT|nr:multidrug efflux RND transporter permease subunit [Mangrovibacterium diazotrophicum]RKD92139.1 HAE1 family hydrophobic/amphiphilic exporter-1 [Mangrovibacterium diazotrophicum]